MEAYKKIESQINAVKEYNQEAGRQLQMQLQDAKIKRWTKEEFSDYIKSENDVADEHYTLDEDKEHAEIRDIQDAIIGFYGE